MSAMDSEEPSKLQVAICALYILAFLFAVALSFQPYDASLRLRYAEVLLALVLTLLFSRYRLAMIASGLAMLTLRCFIGIIAFPQHSLVFVAIGAIAAFAAYALFRTAARREQV